MKTQPLDAVRVDGGTQPRSAIDEAVVREYADALLAGDRFPPVVVFHDGVHCWLADGFHRLHAHRRAKVMTIEVDQRSGTREDAFRYSLGANVDHGLRRNDGDLKRAIQLAIKQWPDLNDYAIAEIVRCDHRWVARTRDSAEVGTVPTSPPMKLPRGVKLPETPKRGQKKAALFKLLKDEAWKSQPAELIASKLGCSVGMVHKCRNELGLPTLRSQRVRQKRKPKAQPPPDEADVQPVPAAESVTREPTKQQRPPPETTAERLIEQYGEDYARAVFKAGLTMMNEVY